MVFAHAFTANTALMIPLNVYKPSLVLRVERSNDKSEYKGFQWINELHNEAQCRMKF